MTVTDLPRLAEDTTTPQSQNLALLREHLKDPACEGWHDAICDEIRRLTATILEA